LQPSSDTAAFFLPGLVHQFGNLLLTVQGHVLHFDEQGVKRMQDAVLGVVQRGSASLQVARALLGEQAGATGLGLELAKQLVDLGRVPARERGVSLEMHGEDPTEAIWVAAEPFILAFGEALRRWIQSVPSGSTGTVTVNYQGDGTGGAVVHLGFLPAAGSLPFPLAADEVVRSMARQFDESGGSAQVLPEPGRGIKLHFLAAKYVTGNSH
jgi:hypothetical protein